MITEREWHMQTLKLCDALKSVERMTADLKQVEKLKARIGLLETTLRAAVAALEFYMVERGDDPSKAAPFSAIVTARAVLGMNDQ